MLTAWRTRSLASIDEANAIAGSLQCVWPVRPGTVPIFAESSEQNGTVPFSEAAGRACDRFFDSHILGWIIGQHRRAVNSRNWARVFRRVASRLSLCGGDRRNRFPAKEWAGFKAEGRRYQNLNQRVSGRVSGANTRRITLGTAESSVAQTGLPSTA